MKDSIFEGVSVVGADQAATRAGLIYGFIAYGIWGIVPVYFKFVRVVPPREILAHRIVWSAVFLLGFLSLTRRLPTLGAVFRSPRPLALLGLSTLFIAGNWYVFIYSVLTNQMLQGSLGYFILPIVNVAVGTLFFGEKMRLPQWIALCFATAGVLALIVWLGMFPWIALTLAFSFSIYGIIRKHTPVDGTVGLTVETLLLAPLALVALAYWHAGDELVFFHLDNYMRLLVVLSGLITSIPLVCFAQAVQRLRIVTIGFLQYISPSLAFLIAVRFYGEDFSPAYQVGYGLIWCGLVVFVLDALRSGWKTREAGRGEADEKIREMEIMN